MRANRAFALRRIVWQVRRSTPRIARPLSRVLPSFEPPKSPILVLGCPRSGTSILYEALVRSPELRSVQSEGHILWDEFHHPRDRGWDSDALDPGDVGEREREYVYCAVRLFVRRARFLDKTPESSLRVRYLDTLFPDATFVFLRRSAAPTVSSLVEAWKARPRFVKYRLPETLNGLGPLSGNQWSFAPKTYENTNASQTGCTETPIRTKTIDALSNRERGRSALRIPIGIAISRNMSVPPMMSEAVTGSAFLITSLAWSRVRVERPKSPFSRWPTNFAYCSGREP